MDADPEPSTAVVEAVEPVTVERLAVRAGTSVDVVERLGGLRIIRRGADGAFTTEDVPRVRLALALESSGVSLEDFAKGVAAGKLSLEFAGHLLDEPRGALFSTQRELFEELGLSSDWTDRLAVSIGLSPDAGDRPVQEDDAELIRVIAAFVSAGFSDDRITRFLTAIGDAMRRLMAVESELWREEFVQPALEAGLPHQEMLDRTTTMGPEAERLAHRLVPLLHRRYMDELVFSNTVEWLEAAMAEAGVGRSRVSTDEAIAFLDLSGYTRLTEERGDALAAEHALELFDMVRRTTIGHVGRPVKFLGDGVMLYFADPSDAVVCALDLVDRAGERGLPPARVGVNAGALIQHEGDYFGSTVNVAARIADYARPREVLVSEAARAGCADDLTFTPIGPTALKGVAEPVSLFVASRAAA